MFILTISQAKQVLLRESKFIRKATIIYLEFLEENHKTRNLVFSNTNKYKENLQTQNFASVKNDDKSLENYDTRNSVYVNSTFVDFIDVKNIIPKILGFQKRLII